MVFAKELRQLNNNKIELRFPKIYKMIKFKYIICANDKWWKTKPEIREYLSKEGFEEELKDVRFSKFKI